VHDPADLAYAFASDGNHVPALAHRHGHVGRAMVRLERAHDALENANQFAVRRAQLAPDSPQRRGGVVAHRPVLADRALDRLLLLARHEQPVDERREHGSQYGRTALVTERFARPTGGPQQQRAAEEIGRAPHDARDSQSPDRFVELGDRLGVPRGLAGDEATHRGDAAMLGLEPRQLGARRERTHARRARCGRGESGHQLQQPRILEDAERVPVHRSDAPRTTNPNGTARPFGLGPATDASTLTPACSTPRARSR
jgi:hypothetical protein